MPHYTVQQRNAAVDAYSKAFRDVAKAADILREQNPYWMAQDKKTVEKFIKDQQDKLERLHDLADQYHKRPPPNPKKVSDDEARKCAAILKAGYKTEKTLTFGRMKNGKRREEVREWREYYSSIHEACLMEPYLYEVCDKHLVSPAHLLKRMHEVDPNLVMRCRDMKRALSPEERDERRKAAKRNLEQYEREGSDFPRRIVYLDEFAIWMVPKNVRKGAPGQGW
jgi:hypothetical protein